MPVLDNNKVPWFQLATEAELGSPRTNTGGLTLLQTLAQPRELGARFFTQDTKAFWEIVEIPVGARIAVLSSSPGSVSSMAFMLPPPRIRIFNSTPVQIGFTRDGATVTCSGNVIASLEDVPKQLLQDPSYRFQLEMLRYVPRRGRRVSGQGFKPMPQGFYHPCNWINGISPTPAVAGTRFGSQYFPASGSVNRQSEWPLAGLAEMSQIAIPVSEVFAPWFSRYNIQDAFGNAVESLIYWVGANQKRRYPRGVWSYGKNPFLGVFKFRYAAYDLANTRYIVGPHSEPVFVRPKKWPTKPSGSYPHTRVVNTDPPTENYVWLVAGVGGRVNGRVP